LYKNSQFITTLYTKVVCDIFIVINKAQKYMEEEFKKSLENAAAQMRKGVLEFAILLVIAKQKTYANEIIAVMKEAKLTVVEGTVYPLLSRLKNSGLLDYDWEESKSGPPRKYYTLTNKGQQFLNGCEEQWNTLEKAIANLKK
jgi:PadR family transcriptional regulator PadR